MSRRLIVEADGGSRGNPGPAAYGALVRDPETGDVLAEVAETIGTATNNAAEYRGVIAGLRLAADIDPSAHLTVRLDSKLIVEQMSGRWKIKNADLRPLALEAKRAFPAHLVSYEWVSRSQNTHADRLVNQALDGAGSNPAAAPSPALHAPPPVVAPAATTEVTTVVLVRHGQTANTVARLFSGGGVPGVSLDETGRMQAERAAAALSPTRATALIASPMIRTAETAAPIADRLGLEVIVDVDWRECEFGSWEGLPIDEIMVRFPAEAEAWYTSTAAPVPGGESLDAMAARVMAARDRLLERYVGQTVVVVTHSLPIRAVMCAALGAPSIAIHRMRPAPGSMTELVVDAVRGPTVSAFGMRP